MTEAQPTIYTDDYFDDIVDGALRSARRLAPLLLKLITPQSVIDVGCGRGAWLRAFQENGVPAIRGLDGPYQVRDKLLIDPAHFQVADLAQPFEVDARYDLAVCLEVAEHLPLRRARPLVDVLVKAAPLVLFSAAIPGQGGRGHVNEQWPAFWRELFDKHDYRRLDPLRRHVWQEAEIDWWYRQNLFLFASAEAVAASAVLQEEERRTHQHPQLECIHEEVLARYVSFRGLLRELPGSAWRAIKRRLY
jgi:SAM-dependent methyltransferase